MSQQQVILVTGPPGCGKTTILLRAVQIIEELGYRVGGIVTEEIRGDGARLGFRLRDLLTAEGAVLSHVDQKIGVRIGKYHIKREALEVTGKRALERAVREADVICCDEFGPMELTSLSFVEAASLALASRKPFIGSIHHRARHPFIQRLRTVGEIIEVSISNRDSLPHEIVGRLRLQKR